MACSLVRSPHEEHCYNRYGCYSYDDRDENQIAPGQGSGGTRSWLGDDNSGRILDLLAVQRRRDGNADRACSVTRDEVGGGTGVLCQVAKRASQRPGIGRTGEARGWRTHRRGRESFAGFRLNADRDRTDRHGQKHWNRRCSDRDLCACGRRDPVEASCDRKGSGASSRTGGEGSGSPGR